MIRRFLYFLPGLTGANAAVLKTAGILDRFSSPGGRVIEHQVTPWREGPAGSGVCISPGCMQPAYDPAGQTWAESAAGDWWVGFDGIVPRPEDLQREMPLGGWELRLVDGEQWRAPRVVKWNAAGNCWRADVPTAKKQIKGGKVIDRPRAEFVPVLTLAMRVLDYMAELGGGMPTEELFTTAAMFLAQNYRIGPEEAGLIGMLDQEAMIKIIQYAVDYPNYQETARQAELQGIVPFEPSIEEIQV